MIKRPDFRGFRQFLILLYKGLLLRKRHYIVTFFEIVIPVLIASIFAIVGSESNWSESSYERFDRDSRYKNYTTYKPFSPYEKAISSYYDLHFVYAPSNDIIDAFINETVERLQFNSKMQNEIKIHGVRNEKDLEMYALYTQSGSSKIVVIGTVFNNIPSPLIALPESLDYKIRYADNGYGNAFFTNQKYRVNGPNYDTQYIQSYFLGWQAAVDDTFIARKMAISGNKLDYRVSMQRFPYPEHKDTSNMFSLINLVPLLIGYGFFIFMTNIIRRVIEEKINGSKELMKMMGMTDCLYWTSTFTNYFIVGLVNSLIITIIYKATLKHGYVFLKSTNFFLLFLMILLFVVSIILFCMAMTIFFNKAVFATVTFIIIYVISFQLFMQTYFTGQSENYFTLPVGQKLGICLLPTGSLLTMFYLISFSESPGGEGIQWSNLSKATDIPDLSMSMVLLTMLGSCLLYIVIIWYFDKVWPWQPGVPKPFYFLFTKSYWCGAECNDTGEIELMAQNDISTDFFEQEPRTAPGVVIENLSKEFLVGFQKKLAVNNVSLNMYKGQITALLGHNGAGKTTTINILTGLYTPSKGTASINGLDILKNTSSARRGLGVCPQHNVLFDTLTVMEHLKIFAGLKGVAWSQLTTEALKVLEILKLTPKKDELVKNLSGGMKRKLSLANAIVGGSNVLFLDEPTSGLDVEARRSVWDALLDIRQDRTIILTTHYMEEADILGDRIAIMAEGEIQCCGSPMFLKRKFGTGYHLHIVKGADFDTNTTTSLLQSYIPQIVLEKQLENEITYNLSSNTASNFGDMFEDLENQKQKLGINSCGITVTTMEDVFLNVANISDMKYSMKGERHLQNGVSMEFEDVYGSSKEMKKQNIVNQFIGLIEKRFHYTKRHYSILITQLVLPFLVLCLCLYVIKATQNQLRGVYDPLTLDIHNVYGRTDGFYYSTGETKLTEDISNVLKGNDMSVQNVKNPYHYVLDYGKRDLINYLKTLMVGASIDTFANSTKNLTAWYNGEPYHATPMSLLLMHTAILKHVSSDKATITLTNAPLPKILPQYGGSNSGFLESTLASVFIPQALSFLSASFVLLPIHERVSKAKLLQLMTGVPHALYWTTMFLWDFMISFVVSILLIIPFAAFFQYVFFGAHSNAIGTGLLMLWLYGFSSIPFSYLISFLFQKGNTGFSMSIAISSVLGIGVSSTIVSLRGMLETRDVPVLDAFIWVFRLVPAYSVSSGFSNLFYIAFNNAYCEGLSAEDLEYNCNSTTMTERNPLFKCCTDKCGFSCLNQTSFMTWDRYGCGRDTFFLALTGILFFSLLIFLETSLFQTMIRHLQFQMQKLRKKLVRDICHSDIVEDTDVIQEEQRIQNLCDTLGDPGNEALVIKGLTKIFRNFYAVDHLSVGIHQEECFGLLGVNGAGKTTTFRMLTGDCQPTEGNAFTSESSLIASAKKFQSYLGYCPQFDALIDRLTGRETLTLFARLRGLSGTELHDRVTQLIRMTDLAAHADKQTQFYSGGNKRKLSVGMALIGSPPLILLDEPTAGVDPVSRRKIWNILAQARNSTKAAIILTTHSMEESEALCSRLAIMVNGRFRCLGSIQQLKSKFGQGYSLVIKMQKEQADNPAAVNEIKQYISNSLQQAELKDDHQGMLQYHVTDPNIRLSQLFKLMAEMKQQLSLEDYLISDTSLEQIFLTFARAQRITE